MIRSVRYMYHKLWSKWLPQTSPSKFRRCGVLLSWGICLGQKAHDFHHHLNAEKHLCKALGPTCPQNWSCMWWSFDGVFGGALHAVHDRHSTHGSCTWFNCPLTCWDLSRVGQQCHLQKEYAHRHRHVGHLDIHVHVSNSWMIVICNWEWTIYNFSGPSIGSIFR